MKLRIGPYPLTSGEVSGALGDLGVLIPLEAALIAVNGLNPTSTLLGVGIIYILSGWYFRIPVPVQPLKALAVIAVAHQLSPSVIAAGALLMAACLSLLSATRALAFLERVVPTWVIRGVQAGLGLLLLKSAYQMVFQKPFLLSGVELTAQVGSLAIPAGVLVGVGSVVLLLLLLRFRQVPAALVIVAVGVIIGLLSGGLSTPLSLGPVPMALQLPSGSDFQMAFVLLVIPQIPLTLANSVIATADAARVYFGPQAERATPTRLAVSIALGNLWAGLTGGLPNCHGSGGLTSHYKLGARTPLATTLLGVVLIAVALLFGRSAFETRALLPAATLGALLAYVGVQHLLLGARVEKRTEIVLVAAVAIVALAFNGNLAIGAGAGLGAHWAWKAVSSSLYRAGDSRAWRRSRKA